MQLTSDDDSDDSEPGIEETDRVSRTRRSRIADDSLCKALSKAPPATAKIAARPKWLPPGRPLNSSSGNPVYGYRMQLFCRTGFHLAILPDGKVRGVDVDRHPNGIFDFSSVSVGEVQIRSVAANLFLAMNERGRIYGEMDGEAPNTVFVEYMFGQYNTYLSKHGHTKDGSLQSRNRVKPNRETRLVGDRKRPNSFLGEFEIDGHWKTIKQGVEHKTNKNLMYDCIEATNRLHRDCLSNSGIKV